MTFIITIVKKNNKGRTITIGSTNNILAAGVHTAKSCIETASQRDGKNRMKVADIFIALLKREIIRSELENFVETEKDHG